MSIYTQTLFLQEQGRVELLGEREHYVVPCIPIVPGVLNGSLVPLEEIERFHESWNGRPLPVYHPTDNGVPVSANTPERIAQHSVGNFWNAYIEDGRLKGELWIDIGQAEHLGGEALQALEMVRNGERLELSTAFWADEDNIAGTYDGTPYTSICRNLRPDHIALLPNGVGACSWEDGAGAPRVNQEEKRMEEENEQPEQTDEQDRGRLEAFWTFLQTHFPLSASKEQEQEKNSDDSLHINLTDGDVRQALYSELAKEQNVPISDVYIDSLSMDEMSFTYRRGERLKKRSYTMEDGLIRLVDDEMDVQQQTSTIIAEAKNGGQGMPEDGKTKEELVTELITHGRSSWQEADREFLAALTAEQLQRFTQEVDTRPTFQAKREPKTLEESLDAIENEEYRAAIMANIKAHRRQKVATIESILANKKCTYTEAQLQAMDDDMLEATAKAFAAPVANYAGVGMPVSYAALHTEEEDQPPPAPNTLQAAVELRKKRDGRA